MRYEARKDGQPVLLFRDRPGVLLSTAPRPIGFEPPKHPFVDAQALDGAFESTIGALLAKSSSVKQFVKTLTKAGFEVVAE